MSIDIDEYEVCKICSHKSTGIHFGVPSCDECKWFYQRSIVKNESYSCFFNDNCLINKYSRNRCKACRFKKCQKEGMSINESDLERIRNQVIERAALSNINNIQSTQSASDLDELDLKRKQVPNLSTAIYLSLKINADQESMNYMNTFNVQNILNRHSTFRTANIVAKTSINENFIIYISLLKNKAYQIYKLNISKSELLLNIEKRLATCNYIKHSENNLSTDMLWDCFFQTQIETAIWTGKYAKQLPGFDKFDLDDFSAIIDSAAPLLLGVQVNKYWKKLNDSTIFKNVLFTKDSYRLIFGKTFSDLVFKFHDAFDQLEMNEHEISLFFPFILASCNENIIKDRLCLSQMKAKYTRALIYVFELNKRSPTFYQEFSDAISLINNIEVYKDKILQRS